MNLLSLPGKASLPVDLAAALRQHIADHFKDAHPDTYSADYDAIRKLRAAITFKSGGKAEVHVSLLQQIVTYHAQLVFLLNKFPADVGVSFQWSPIFASSAGFTAALPGMMPSQAPIALADLNYERAAILFNIAAMHASLGATETRTEQEGIKRALAHFQHAAGCFAHLADEVVSTVRIGPNEPSPCSPDFSAEALKALENLCLAQAQECFWQKAVLDRLKNGTIAKLSARVAELYTLALESAQAAKGAGGTWPAFSLPQDLINHVTIKAAHFSAAAQYRKSCDDLSANKYGDEIARLRAAEASLKEGLAAVRRGVSSSVIDDMKGLQGMVTDNLARAIKDNDLVYLDPIPTLANLADIAPASMVKPTVPLTVSSPLDALHDDPHGLGQPFFETLVPYAVHQAISVYTDRVESFIRSEVASRVEELNAVAASTLQSLGLPGAIQMRTKLPALEAPVGLPPALLRKAAEVRADNGPSKLRAMLQDVQRLANSNQATLDEAQTQLDAEAAEDEQARASYGDSWVRPESGTAGGQLYARTASYRQTLTKARESDALVRQRYGEWEYAIATLGASEADLQAAIPSSSAATRSYFTSDPNPKQTTAVRQLRRHLERLDDLTANRADLLADARRLAAADDIRPAVLRTATAHDISAAAFEPLFERELAKYGRFEDELSDNANQQEDELESVRHANDTFLSARREDPSLKARERALQDLDLAYHKYRELVANLTEGLRFYGDFARMLNDHRTASEEWVRARRREARDYTTALTERTTSRLSLGESSPRAVRPGQWDPSQPVRFG